MGIGGNGVGSAGLSVSRRAGLIDQALQAAKAPAGVRLHKDGAANADVVQAQPGDLRDITLLYTPVDADVQVRLPGAQLYDPVQDFGQKLGSVETGMHGQEKNAVNGVGQ